MSHQGYVCAGDYTSPHERELSQKLYMVKRGTVIYYTVIAHWLTLGGLCAGVIMQELMTKMS